MSTQGRKPLSHLTVLDMTVNVPGPFCSTILSDLGARVIKVEPPGGDPLRHSPGMWASLNRGKQSIVLDLKTAEGQRALAALAGVTDIVLEGWRPGVAQRLGADYHTLSAQNPRLAYCSISGFGQDGPWRARPGHDLNYLALSGYLSVQAAIEGRPWPPPVLVSDLVSGLYCAIAVLASLAGSQVTGQGSYVDLSMTEAALSLLGPEIGQATSGNGDGRHPNVTRIPHYGLFLCADGKWISVGIVHEDHFWDRLCSAAGLEDLAGVRFDERLQRGADIERALHETFAQKPSYEWEEVLRRADVPASAVVDLDEAFASPQFQARGAFVDLGLHRFVSQPFRFSTGSVAPDQPPPELGEHTDAILAELRLSTDEQDEPSRSRVVG